MTLPAGTALVDPGTAQVTGRTLTWTFNLAQAQTLGFDVWITLPAMAGPTTFDASIQTGTSGNFVKYTDALLTVTSVAPPTLAQVIALAKSSRSFVLVAALLSTAQALENKGCADTALLFLIGAADALIGNTTSQGIALRLDIDQLIWALSPGL
jgi:hypothetical protein